VCFSPEADLLGGIVIGAIGVDACRHMKSERSHLLLAGLPLLLGAHQAIETFVWWGVEGVVPHTVGRIALWLYLLIAFVVLPVFIPAAVLAIEPLDRRRYIAPFVALGAAVSAVLLFVMVRGPIGVTAQPYHLAYSANLSHGGLVIVLYVIAVCGPLLFSGYRHIAIFGIANLIAVVVLARLTVDGFASIWCAYAAITSAAIALHMRYGRGDPWIGSARRKRPAIVDQ
jgi:hypothetical protein